VDPWGLETLRQVVEAGWLDTMLKNAWKSGTTTEVETGRWINRGLHPGRKFYGDTQGINLGHRPRNAIGHIHTHTRPEHVREPSGQDLQQANTIGLPGVVLVIDPTSPNGYRVIIFGPGADAQIACSLLFGRPPPGVSYELTSDGRCVSVVTDQNKLDRWLARKAEVRRKSEEFREQMKRKDAANNDADCPD